MIVVVGSPAWRPAEPAGPAGRTCEIALAAAAAGARVELVGRIGDDRAGDALVLALAGSGVGHAAVLRDPARATPLAATAPEPDTLDVFGEEPPPRVATDGTAPRLQPADVSLGLSYLTAFAVLVAADDAPLEVLPACVAGASFAGAHLVVLLPAADPAPADLPAAATVLAAPGPDDGAFGALVGTYAAGLDAGREPADAFRAATSGIGWEPGGA
jgi:sugar/nucleoside kinase (ribokinase family)